MIDLAALALASLLGREELLYHPLPRQGGPGDCGPAVVEALLGPESRAGPAAGVEGLSLGDLERRLAEASVPCRARRLGLGELDLLLDRGFAPLVLNYDRPRPHWALLLGRLGGDYAIGDPGRGLELLDAGLLSRRYSGAALVLDPGGLDPGRLALLAEAEDRIARRRAFLLGAAERGTQAPASLPDPARPASDDRVTPSGWELRTRVDACLVERPSLLWSSLSLLVGEPGPGPSLEGGLSLRLEESGPSLSPLLRGDFGLRLDGGLLRLGLGVSGEEVLGRLPASRAGMTPFLLDLGLLLFRDPLLLSLGAAISFRPSRAEGEGGGPPQASIFLCLVEALGSELGLRVETGLEWRGGGPAVFLGLGLALGGEGYGLSLRYLEGDGRRGLGGSFDYRVIGGEARPGRS